MESLKDWELASVGVRVMEGEKTDQIWKREDACIPTFKMVKVRRIKTWMEKDWNEKRKVYDWSWGIEKV